MKRVILVVTLAIVILGGVVVGDIIVARSEESTAEKQRQLQEIIATKDQIRAKKDVNSRLDNLEYRLKTLERWQVEHDREYHRLRNDVRDLRQKARRV